MEIKAKDSVSKGSVTPTDDGSASFAIAQAEDANPELTPGSDAPAETSKEETEAGEEAGKETSEEEQETPTPGGKKGGKEKESEEAGEDEEGEEAPDEKLPKGVVKRLAKMRAKQGDAEREAERLRSENETLKAASTKQAELRAKPNPADFDTEAEFIEALTDWKLSTALQKENKDRTEREEADRQARKEAEGRERFLETQQKLKAGSKKYKDFANVVFSDDLPITQGMTDIMARFDNIADVAYYLGKHPDECRTIAVTGIADQALSLKEISDKLKAAERKHTKAPKPIQPLAGTGAGIKDLSSMSYPEYKKAMEEREKAARGH